MSFSEQKVCIILSFSVFFLENQLFAHHRDIHCTIMFASAIAEMFSVCHLSFSALNNDCSDITEIESQYVRI